MSDFVENVKKVCPQNPPHIVSAAAHIYDELNHVKIILYREINPYRQIRMVYDGGFLKTM